MSVTATPTATPLVATTADAAASPTAIDVTLRDDRGRIIAWLPASREEATALRDALTAALTATAPRDDALTDALADAWTTALTDEQRSWLAAHPLV